MEVFHEIFVCATWDVLYLSINQGNFAMLGLYMFTIANLYAMIINILSWQYVCATRLQLDEWLMYPFLHVSMNYVHTWMQANIHKKALHTRHHNVNTTCKMTPHEYTNTNPHIIAALAQNWYRIRL